MHAKFHGRRIGSRIAASTGSATGARMQRGIVIPSRKTFSPHWYIFQTQCAVLNDLLPQLYVWCAVFRPDRHLELMRRQSGSVEFQAFRSRRHTEVGSSVIRAILPATSTPDQGGKAKLYPEMYPEERN